VSSQKGRDGQFGTVDRFALEQGQKRNLDLAKLQACIKAQNDEAVKASLREGEALGLGSTPTLFVNGQQIEGAVPIGEMRAVLDRALEQAGVPAPARPAAAPSPTASQPSSK